MAKDKFGKMETIVNEREEVYYTFKNTRIKVSYLCLP